MSFDWNHVEKILNSTIIMKINKEGKLKKIALKDSMGKIEKEEMDFFLNWLKINQNNGRFKRKR